MGNTQEKKELKQIRKNKKHNSEKQREALHYSDDEINDKELEKEVDDIIKYDIEEKKKEELNRSKSVNQVKRKKKKFDEDDFDSDSDSDDDYYEYKRRKQMKKKNKKKKKEKEKENKNEKTNDINIEMKNQKINNNKDNNIVNSENVNEKDMKVLNINQIYSNDGFNDDDLNLEQIDINNEIIKRKKFSQSVLPNYNIQKINEPNNPHSKNENQLKKSLLEKTNSDDIINYYQKKNNNINNAQVNINNNLVNLDNNQIQDINNIDNINYMSYNNNKINNNLYNNNRIIPHNVYAKIDKRDLKTIIVCMQKCNEKYEEAIALNQKSLYVQGLNTLIKTRNSYIKLKNAILVRSDCYPKEFQQIMTIKIAEKVSKINLVIGQISPLASSQKEALYNHFKGKKPSNNQDLKIINQKENYDKFIDNILTNPQRNPIINEKKINKYPNIENLDNNNINNKKIENSKKKSIHDKEEDEMDNKIASEIMVTNPGVKFSDIVGMKDLKQMVYEIIIIPTIRPDLFTGVLKPQRGILLFGPPGTGKTMIAKAIASECSSTFFNISASSLTSKWVGESEKTVRSLFKLAYQKSPSIIFIDEIDSILSKRSENDNDAAKRLKTEFLIQFDGLGSNSNAKLLVIAATNRPMDLDDALLRRLPKRVYCHPLDENGRFDFIKKLINQVDNNLKDDQIKYIAKKTNGYSNGDLQELCREAAYEPVRELKGEEILKIKKFRDVTFDDLKKALLKIRGTLSSKVIQELDNWNNQFGGI